MSLSLETQRALNDENLIESLKLFLSEYGTEIEATFNDSIDSWNRNFTTLLFPLDII